MSRLTDHAGQLLAQLKEQPALTEQLPDAILSSTALAITQCPDALQQLKEFALHYNFPDPAEEIDFFKPIKPPFMAELLYYTKIYQLHLRWPVCSIPMQQEYLRNALMQLQQFVDEHREFYMYYRSGHTDRDDHYFMRGHADARLLPIGILFNAGHTFSTGYDLLLANLLANDRLKEYLEEQLANLAHENPAAAKTAKYQSNGQMT